MHYLIAPASYIASCKQANITHITLNQRMKMFSQPEVAPASSLLRNNEQAELRQQYGAMATEGPRHGASLNETRISYDQQGVLRLESLKIGDAEKTRNNLIHYLPTVPNAQSRSPYDFQDSLHSSVVQVRLEQVELWQEFYHVGTEMILTKSGRRMFPGCRIQLSGLKSDSYYCVFMSVERVDGNRYRYQNGHWVSAGPGEVEFPKRYFVHQDSPTTGAKWMESEVSFHKVKLTNSNASSNHTNGKLIVHSMHRYQICIHISESIDPMRNCSTLKFPLPVTTFVTVTAYQNAQLTKLKIANNPFAKGFRDDGARCGKSPRTTSPLHETPSSRPYQNEPGSTEQSRSGEHMTDRRETELSYRPANATYRADANYESYSSGAQQEACHCCQGQPLIPANSMTDLYNRRRPTEFHAPFLQLNDSHRYNNTMYFSDQYCQPIDRATLDYHFGAHAHSRQSTNGGQMF